MIFDRSRVDLAAELRAARLRSGRTLRQLQAATYASDSALSRYLAGRSVPPWIVVAALSREAGDDPERLRPLWQRAKAEAARRRQLGRAEDVQTALARHLSTIATDVATAIDDLRKRGAVIPENLLSAASRLRDAERLVKQG